MKVASGGIVAFLVAIFVLAAGQAGTFGQGRELIRGGGFEDGYSGGWDQWSVQGVDLIQAVDPAIAHTGTGIARLGTFSRTTDTLEQPIGAFAAFAQSGTLSFYWRVENPKPKNTDVLYAELVDAKSGQIIPLASLNATAGTNGWTRASISFTPYELGLSSKTDYLLRFEAAARLSPSPKV